MTDLPAIGRPRAFDADAALDRALELFWANGFRATTTRELESALGLSQSSISNAFGSKHDLLMRALDRYEQRVTASVVAPLEAAAGLDGLLAFFDALVAWVTGDGGRGCMLTNLMAEDGGDHPEVAARTRAYRGRVMTALRAAVSAAVDRGEATAGDVDDRAGLLYGVVLGINIAARGGAAPAELEFVAGGARSAIRGWRLPH